MAFSFNGTNQYISVLGAPVTTMPLTMACFHTSTSIAASYSVMSLCSASNGRYQISYSTGIGMQVSQVNNAGTTVSSSPGYSTSTSVNNHYCATFSSSNMDLYVNGTTVGSTTPSGLTTTGIISAYFGARFSTTIGAYMPGTIAEAAIWNIALAAADINSLSKGISPLLIHPQNLVMYAPLIRNLQDIKHGYPLINNNAATVATHPKIYKI